MKQFGRIIVSATELGMTMGLMAAGLAMLGLFLGRWVDSQLGTAPVITLTLLIAGAVTGQIAIYRLALSSSRRLLAQGAGLRPRVLPRFSLALHALFMVVLPGLIGLAIGLWLDYALRIRIIATLILTLGGLAVGVMGSLRLARTARLTPGQRDDQACSEVKRD